MSPKAVSFDRQKYGLAGVIHRDERCGADLVSELWDVSVIKLRVYVCVCSLCSPEWCVCVGMALGLTCWLMASVRMCENTPGPVSMLMSSGRWERGGWSNNEQTHQQPHNLKGPADPPVVSVSQKIIWSLWSLWAWLKITSWCNDIITAWLKSSSYRASICSLATAVTKVLRHSDWCWLTISEDWSDWISDRTFVKRTNIIVTNAAGLRIFFKYTYL